MSEGQPSDARARIMTISWHHREGESMEDKKNEASMHRNQVPIPRPVRGVSFLIGLVAIFSAVILII